MKKLCYAGIGSRRSDVSALQAITKISKTLGDMGYYVRTGAADGCDMAFAMGNPSRVIYYLPWAKYQRDFINKVSGMNPIIGCTEPSPIAIEQASNIHPNWSACGPGAQKLHGRNCHIINGASLNSPVDFVIAHTPDGLNTGGTSLGINYASSLGIPVFNIGIDKDIIVDDVIDWVDSIEASKDKSLPAFY